MAEIKARPGPFSVTQRAAQRIGEILASENRADLKLRITVSGGIARSDLMCEILASVLDRPLERLASAEGPALGAAVTALAALETHRRRQRDIEAPFGVADKSSPNWIKTV